MVHGIYPGCGIRMRRRLRTKLVITTDEADALRVDDLEREEQRDHLELMGATVNPVAIEDVGGGLDVAALV